MTILCWTKYQQGTYSICKAMVDLLLANCQFFYFDKMTMMMMMMVMIMIAMMMKELWSNQSCWSTDGYLHWRVLCFHKSLSCVKIVRLSKFLSLSHLWVSCRHDSGAVWGPSTSHFLIRDAHIFGRVSAQLKFPCSSWGAWRELSNCATLSDKFTILFSSKVLRLSFILCLTLLCHMSWQALGLVFSPWQLTFSCHESWRAPSQ